jgi:hypothetical protein
VASGPPQGRAVALGGLGSCHQDHLVRLRGLPARARQCGGGARAGVTGRAPGSPEGSVPVLPPDVLTSSRHARGGRGPGRHPKVACGGILR